jgi:hypothetical protein
MIALSRGNQGYYSHCHDNAYLFFHLNTFIG